MDNPKKANQGKYSRSKRKKEHFSKGGSSKSHSSSEAGNDSNNRQQQPRDEKSKQKSFKGAPSASPQQPSSTAKASDKASKEDTTAQQKLITANLKKETEEIANLTQKYSRRRIVSTWTRDFEIPEYKDDYYDNDEGADFKELISDYVTDFVGRHFMFKEEQEWMKQAETCDSPFSLDLKCLETGISCIPFYKRHGLSEKSFNPKEVQSMKSEAESNEVIYNGMKDLTQETQKVILNKQNENNDNLICKDFINDNILSILKNHNKKSCDISETNIEDSKNDDVKDEVVKRHTNESKDAESSKISNNLVSKTDSSANKTDSIHSASSSNAVSQDVNRLEPRKERRSRQNDVSITNNENHTFENSNTVRNQEENFTKHNDSENKELNYPDFVITSLEPRSQRRPRRDTKQQNETMTVNEIDESNFPEYSFIGLNPRSKKMTDNYFKENNTNYVSQSDDRDSSKMTMDYQTEVDDPSCSWSIDLVSTNGDDKDAKSRTATVDFIKHELRDQPDKETNGDDSVPSSVNKDDLALIRAEIDDNCDKFSIILPNKLKRERSNESYNDNSDNEDKIELNLSCLKKSEGVVETSVVENNGSNKTFCDTAIKSSGNDKLNKLEENLLSFDSVKIETKINTKNYDKCSSETNSNLVTVEKTNESSSISFDDDDDLDFLLGLDKPSTNPSLSSDSKVKDYSSSNLSILQEKLKGAGVKKVDKPETVKKSIEKKASTVVPTSGNHPDEDLDEWLDSVLES